MHRVKHFYCCCFAYDCQSHPSSPKNIYYPSYNPKLRVNSLFWRVYFNPNPHHHHYHPHHYHHNHQVLFLQQFRIFIVPESILLNFKDKLCVCVCVCVCVYTCVQGFPSGSVVKNLPANTGDTGSMDLIPGSGRSP